MESAYAYIRVLLRALQSIFSLIAVSTMSATFRSVSFESNIQSASLGSSISTFVTILTYSSLMYCLWYLIGVEITKRYLICRLQSSICDAIFIVLYIIAGLILATSSYARHCESYNGLLRCGNVHAAVLFLFLNLAAFVASRVLDTFEPKGNGLRNEAGVEQQEEDDAVSYAGSWTPKVFDKPL